MSFDNATMRQPVNGKPHIALIDGWYRVSKWRKGAKHSLERWQAAHKYISGLNGDLQDAKRSKK